MSTTTEKTSAPADHRAAAEEYFKPAAAETKSEVKTEAKVETKTEAKVETKTEAKTDTTEAKTTLPTFVKTKEAPKVEAKVETVAQAPEFEKLIGPDEKSKHRPDWDKMKATAAAEYKRAAELEKKAKELEAKLAARGPEQADEATKARLQELENQIKEYDSKLKVHDLQSHPDFVKQYVEPQKKAVSTIEEALKLEGVTSADVKQILALEGKAFVEGVSKLLPELSEFNRPVVAAAFREAKALQAAAKDALGNVDQLRQQYAQNFAARSKASFDAVSKDFADTLLPLTPGEKATDAEKSDIEAYNQSLVALDKKAEALAFGKTDERTISEMAHKAARFDFVIEQVIPRFAKAAQAEIDVREAELATLRQQVKDMTGAKPTVGGGSGDGDAVKKEAAPANHLAAAQSYFQS